MVVQGNDRQLAELQFKIGLTLQYLNQPSEALTEVQEAVKICEAAFQEQKQVKAFHSLLGKDSQMHCLLPRC